MKRNRKITGLCLCAVLAMALQGCTSSAESIQPETTPKTTPITKKAEVDWPSDKLEQDGAGVPTLSVYVVEDKTTENIDIETYVQGVLAGEMKNDWPMEALKAQAILARTFVLKFVQEKKSRYHDADISTDIEEAQAYAADEINDRIKQAVSETAGLVLSADGELPYSWFHAHSGGKTAMAKEGLGWEQPEPIYTRVAPGTEPEPGSIDSDALAEAASWKASFSLSQFAAACKKAGKTVKLTADSDITIGERGQSGRAVTLIVNDQTISASELRIAIGSKEMKSTLLTSLKISGDQVLMEGKGYGHGVGMSQWGAYGMAEEGKKAEEIIRHYFGNVALVKLW